MARLGLLCTTVAFGASLICATASAQEAALEQRDPLEHLNRAVFSFNHSLHDTVLRPVSGAYAALPEGVQKGVDNFFSNLREPVVTVASALQGDGSNSVKSAGRFVVNSTAGIGGIFDVATPLGLVSRPEDLGLTLCHYGVPQGPYLVLPLIGPSNGRDFAALAATYAVTYNLVGSHTLPYLAVDGAVAHAADDGTHEHDLPDFYAVTREAYLSKRALACEDALGPDMLKASPYGQVTLRTAALDTSTIDASEALDDAEQLIDDLESEAEDALEELTPDASPQPEQPASDNAG